MGINLFVLGESDNIGNQFLFELRDAVIQRDRMRFRRNLERLGEILAYELSKKLAYRTQTLKTSLGKLSMNVLTEQPVLVTILRAGIPFHQGFLNFFDRADSGFIGAYRNEEGKVLTVNLDYIALPSLTNRPVILIDPMLATGRSIVDSIDLLLSKGKPSHLYIVSVVAAPEGLQHVKENVNVPYSLWTCAVDDKLDSSYYIVPGLGDAGDLSFGLRE